MMKSTTLLYLSALLLLASCSPKYIARVNPDTKTKFGFEATTPSVGIFFVENENTAIGLLGVEQHNKMADKMYNKYSPARTDFYIGQTNAKDFKFNLKKKTYYIETKNLPQRTAMIIFDGKHKPTVYFESEKYEAIIKSVILKSQKNDKRNNKQNRQ